MTSVLIADDQSLVRAGFRMLIENTSDLSVVAEAQDGLEAVALAGELRPDLVMMDIRMPNLNGIAATKQIGENPNLGGTKVLVVTTFDTDDHLIEAIRAGASGFVGKDAPPDLVLDAIRSIHLGGFVLPESIRELVASQAQTSGESASRLQHLTPRETEIVKVIGTGLNNEEIAESLYISQATVKSHINRVLAKTGARDRSQIVILAYESGLMNPGRSDS